MSAAHLLHTPGERELHTGRRTREWYESCGTDGHLVQKCLIETIYDGKSKHQRYLASLAGPSSSATAAADFEPTYTAMTAPCQGGKSYGSAFVDSFTRVKTLGKLVHITLNPTASSQFTRNLTRNTEPINHPVVELEPCTVEMQPAASQMTCSYVVAATTARLTLLAAQLYNHWLWCRAEDYTYDVVVNLDEADYLLACKGKNEALFRQALYTILGRRPIQAKQSEPRQGRTRQVDAAPLKAFDGKQLPPPRHVFLTTATESDLVVQLEKVRTWCAQLSEAVCMLPL